MTLSLSLPESCKSDDVLSPRERGAKLIQLLLNCARHASSGNLHHADACLRQISQLASVTGDSIQRLASRFASALAVRLVKRWPGLHKALNITVKVSYDPDRAWSIFVRKFPCLRFAYAVINRTLIQALSMERAIHVIDIGSGDPNHWVPFIRSIANRTNPASHLTITCVSRNKPGHEMLLVKEAESLNIPFRFKYVNMSINEVTFDLLDLKPGETVAVTSVLSLHTLLTEDDQIDAQLGVTKRDEVKESQAMNRFLEMVKSTRPKVMLLVEKEANHNSTRLVDRLVEGLHYYSAIFDCIDNAYGGFPCEDRTRLEEMFGKEIEDIVGGEGVERRGRHERFAKWGVRLSRAGFRPVRLWYETMEEAREVVEGYRPGGFKVVGEKGSLMVCWKDRPVYTVSAWGCFGC